MTDETPIRKRIASFLAVVLIASIVGIPLWIFTTSVHRSIIPNVNLDTFGNGFPYIIPVYLIDVPEPLAGLVEDTQIQMDLIKPQIPNVDLHVNFMLDSTTTELDITNDDQRYKVQLVLSDFENETYAISTGPDRLIKIYITENVIANDQVPNFIATVLINHVFSDELDALKNPIKDVVKIDYHPKIILSLDLLRGGSSSLTWNLNSTPFKKFFGFVKLLQLNGFANFQIETQEDWYENRVITPNEFQSEDGKTIIKDTATFIDYSGWGLDQDVGTEPVINFVIYVPDKETIEIENSNSNSFIVPQWGGIVIENGNEDVISDDRMEQIMDIFASQLFQLIGGSKSQKSLYYRIDELIRLQTFHNVINSIENVQSLLKLTQQLKTIPIPEQAVDEINESIEYIKKSFSNRGGQWWIESNMFSSMALQLSDKAFFQKDMLQQAYFPDEHKTAVYSPLLGPFGTIILMGFVRLYKEFKA